jgi:4-hydroxybenzoyl-CoA thioesterase
MEFKFSIEMVVQFGDCDPADIVFYPNYFRWFDAAAHSFLDRLVGTQHQITERYGIIGFPLVEVSAKFFRPSTYGDRITIETAVGEVSERRFVLFHRGMRDGRVLFEGSELRVAARHHPEQSGVLQSVALGDSISNTLKSASC